MILIFRFDTILIKKVRMNKYGRRINAVLWKIYHDQGITNVWALSETVALARFMAKYPNRSVKK